jgi:hypothetical protein
VIQCHDQQGAEDKQVQHPQPIAGGSGALGQGQQRGVTKTGIHVVMIGHMDENLQVLPGGSEICRAHAEAAHFPLGFGCGLAVFDKQIAVNIQAIGEEHITHINTQHGLLFHQLRIDSNMAHEAAVATGRITPGIPKAPVQPVRRRRVTNGAQTPARRIDEIPPVKIPAAIHFQAFGQILERKRFLTGQGENERHENEKQRDSGDRREPAHIP